MANGAKYPVQLELQNPLKVPRLLALFSWLLVIPHVIVLYILQLVLGVLQLVAFFTILFTAKIPKGLFDVMAMVLRYNWRVSSYLFFMRGKYPPFEFVPSELDPGTDPAMMSVEYPPKLSRLLIFVKWLLLIPHLIVILLLAIGALFVLLIAFFAVLITGKWPQGLRNYMVGFMRWTTRVNAYWFFMTDKYPPFRLSE
jgi:Domain of unknown function (DUF4389)